jgi:hypothetical protein
MRALVSHRRHLTPHIAQQHLSSIDALDLHFAFLASLEIKAANILQFKFSRHS